MQTTGRSDCLQQSTLSARLFCLTSFGSCCHFLVFKLFSSHLYRGCLPHGFLPSGFIHPLFVHVANRPTEQAAHNWVSQSVCLSFRENIVSRRGATMMFTLLRIFGLFACVESFISALHSAEVALYNIKEMLNHFNRSWLSSTTGRAHFARP